MADIYTIQDHTGLIPFSNKLSRDQIMQGSERYVEIYSLDEFAAVDLGNADTEEAISFLSHPQDSSVNTLPDCFIGSLAFPDKKEWETHSIHFGFYLSPKRLILIDSTNACQKVLDALKDLDKLSQISTMRILLEVVKYLIKDDVFYFTDIEKQLAHTEDEILDHHTMVTNQELLDFRRKLMRYDRFYQQLTDMSNIIEKDEYLILSKDDRRLFRLLGQRSERLFQRAQYLKEYSVQLRELHQIQVSAEQNKTIQWLTVITTLIVPLTLITSWYGMNFSHMPELTWEYSYAVVIALCIILVVVQLIFFKKRKWL